MLSLTVKSGIKCQVVDSNKGFKPEDFVTKKETMFFREDIVIDPVGKMGCHRGYKATVGGQYAQAGYYGFQPIDWKKNKRSKWILLVPANKVMCR